MITVFCKQIWKWYKIIYFFQNQDGNITANEFQTLFAMYNYTYTADTADAILHLADENKDGIVDFIGNISYIKGMGMYIIQRGVEH